jgi:hypothetical protein
MVVRNCLQASIFLLVTQTIDASIVGEPQTGSNSCSECSTDSTKCCSADVADEEVTLLQDALRKREKLGQLNANRQRPSQATTTTCDEDSDTTTTTCEEDISTTTTTCEEETTTTTDDCWEMQKQKNSTREFCDFM